MGEKIEVSKEFFDQLVKDPKLVGQLQKRAELDAFREEYQVERASPLKCPACSQYGMSGGTLWGPVIDTSDEFVCRKCRLRFRVNCLSMSNDELMIQMRKIQKGDEKAIHAQDERLAGGK